MTRKRCTCMVNCRFNKQLIDPKKSSPNKVCEFQVHHSVRLLLETTPLPAPDYDFEAYFTVHVRGPHRQQTVVQRYTTRTPCMLVLQIAILKSGFFKFTFHMGNFCNIVVVYACLMFISRMCLSSADEASGCTHAGLMFIQMWTWQRWFRLGVSKDMA